MSSSSAIAAGHHRGHTLVVWRCWMMMFGGAGSLVVLLLVGAGTPSCFLLCCFAFLSGLLLFCAGFFCQGTVLLWVH